MNNKDILGEALKNYYLSGISERITVHTSYGPDEEYVSEYFFRSEEELPEIEEYALLQCNNRILEIGSGAGSHALFLQNVGQNITAMDLSGGCVNVMLNRGVKKIIHGDVFQFNLREYDTIIMLMNGIGLVGSLTGLMIFLDKMEKITSPGSQLIFDSTDVRYVLKERIKTDHYIGQVKYQFEYRDKQGPWFDWLFIDPGKLTEYCKNTVWIPQIIYENADGHYLARLQKKY